MEHESATNRRPDRPVASDPAAEHLPPAPCNGTPVRAVR